MRKQILLFLVFPAGISINFICKAKRLARKIDAYTCRDSRSEARKGEHKEKYFAPFLNLLANIIFISIIT